LYISHPSALISGVHALAGNSQCWFDVQLREIPLRHENHPRPVAPDSGLSIPLADGALKSR
jgi:hypothetical protein